jgi:hypothetical protein
MEVNNSCNKTNQAAEHDPAQLVQDNNRREQQHVHAGASTCSRHGLLAGL